MLIDSGNKHACDYFGIKKEDTPAYVIQHGAKKFIKHHSKPKEAASFYKDFLVSLPLQCVPPWAMAGFSDSIVWTATALSDLPWLGIVKAWV